VKKKIKINYGMQPFQFWNRYLEMIRKGTRRVPMSIEKTGTKFSTPEGLYVFVKIVFKSKPPWISRDSEFESWVNSMFGAIYFILSRIIH
jgi:hypothetical protein